MDDDTLCVALLFCATFGVGSMSFGAVFAATGPVLASLAIYFLSACNLHASVAVSKTMTVVPASVRTFSDLGFFAFGATGRRLVVASEAGVCFLSPIAFLILGGTVLLPRLLDDSSRSGTEWIIVMAAGVLPVLLIPTLRASGPLCYVGGIAAVCTDAICIYYSLGYLDFTPRETQIQLNHSIQTFGTIMFATGSAIIIPPIQRQHAQPSRLANLVSLTLLFITSLYLLIGVATYYQYGCTAPATLLDELPAGSRVLKAATGCMLVHVVLAFPVLLQPTLFDVERYLLGKDADIAVLNKRLALEEAKRGVIAESASGKPILGGQYAHYRTHAVGGGAVVHTEDDALLYGNNRVSESSSDTPYVRSVSPTSTAADSSSRRRSISLTDEVDDSQFTLGDRLCSAVVRIVTLAAQTALAVLLQTSFMNVLSVIGATSVTFSCMVMPCLCYLRVYPIDTRTFMGKCDRALCYVIIISSTVLGAYCTFIGAGNIVRDVQKLHFAPIESGGGATSDGGTSADSDAFPFCHEGERN